MTRQLEIFRPGVHTGSAPAVPREVDDSCTTESQNTHSTEEAVVRYRWHPWHELTVRVHATVVRRDKQVLRCTRVAERDVPTLEIPHWMFDRARCCAMRRSDNSAVSLSALETLQRLLLAAGGTTLRQDRDRLPSGDPDDEAPSSQADSPAEPVSRSTDGASMARALEQHTPLHTAASGRTARVHRGSRRRAGGRS